MSAAPAVTLKQVSFRYGDKPVLTDITLDIEEREFLAVVGPNGGGKTTLLKLILGLEKPERGEIRVLGQPPDAMRGRVGYVPQAATLPADFPISVEDVVLLGALTARSFGPRASKRERAAAEQALRAVELFDLRFRRLDSLSGGQRQRALVARALIGAPRLLLLDEPTASVDSRVEQDIFELLQRLNRETTIVLVTHDLGFVSPYVNRVACLNRELVCHQTGEITEEIIEKMYGSSVKVIKHQCEI